MAADGGRGNWDRYSGRNTRTTSGGRGTRNIPRTPSQPGFVGAGASALYQPQSSSSFDPGFQAAGLANSYSDQNAWYQGQQAIRNQQTFGQQQQPPPRFTYTGGGGGGRGGRGGGGGGGGGAPTMSQAELDWAARLLSQRPQQQQFTAFVAPEYQSFTPQAFDNSMFVNARNSLKDAVAGDLATAQGATQNMANYLQANDKNPFANMAVGPGAGGMDQQALAGLLVGQGVNPGANQGMQGAAQGQAAANQAFQNVISALSGNQQAAMQNRQIANQQYGQDAANQINAQNLGLGAGINVAEGNAQAQYKQYLQQLAYQDWQERQNREYQTALGNWQGQNAVSQNNVGINNDWRNNVNSSYLSLLAQAQGLGLTMPDLQALGLI